MLVFTAAMVLFRDFRGVNVFLVGEVVLVVLEEEDAGNSSAYSKGASSIPFVGVVVVSHSNAASCRH
jgi:hypothetical protein